MTPSRPFEPYVCPVCGKASWHPLDAKYGHCAACGANRIQTGVYEVGGTLHVIIPDLLRANGWPATPENVDLVARTAARSLGRVHRPRGPPTPRAAGVTASPKKRGTYWKCAKVVMTRGAATDVRLSWPACDLWEKA